MDSERKTKRKLSVLRQLMIDLGGMAMYDTYNPVERQGFVASSIAAVMAIDVLMDNDVDNAGDLAEFASLDGDVTREVILSEMREAARKGFLINETGGDIHN